MANGTKLSPEWVRTIVIIVAQLAIVFGWGVKLSTEFGNHVDNDEVHYTFKDNSTLFVPRAEIEKELRNINEKLDRLIEDQ